MVDDGLTLVVTSQRVLAGRTTVSLAPAEAVARATAGAEVRGLSLTMVTVCGPDDDVERELQAQGRVGEAPQAVLVSEAPTVAAGDGVIRPLVDDGGMADFLRVTIAAWEPEGVAAAHWNGLIRPDVLLSAEITAVVASRRACECRVVVHTGLGGGNLFGRYATVISAARACDSGHVVLRVGGHKTPD